MYKICMLLFLTGCIVASSGAQETQLYNPFIDVDHYEFTIEVNDLNNEIKAGADITFRFLKGTNTVTFDLISVNSKGNGMKVNGVTENNERLSFEHNVDRLKIKLKNPAKAGDLKIIHIIYSGIPSDGLVFSKNKFGQRTIFGDNWPNRARNWLPCVDHLSDKARVDFMVIAPDHYKVISNGELVEESALSDHKRFTHWKETVPLPTKVMVIGVADFAINYAGNVDCIPVSSWVFPQEKKNGFYDYGQALEILPFFIKNVGPYAYKKLANVEAITVFGGMENASSIFYNEKSITGKRSYSEELIAHEIAHQWFGNSATESGWPHVWLSEGFATEMTNLYLEYKYGEDTLKARLKKDRIEVIKFSKKRYTPVVDSSEKENYMALLNLNSYEKGGWVLHMLRRKLGDSLFWKGIRNYYAAYAGKNASTIDFQQIMEKAGQLDLQEFFQQWIFHSGHPELQITWQYNQKKKLLLLRIIQEQAKLFSFPLELSFDNTGVGKGDHSTVLIKDKITEVTIPQTIKPQQFVADPQTNLLFQATIKEGNIRDPKMK